jgi:amylosucrase
MHDLSLGDIEAKPCVSASLETDFNVLNALFESLYGHHKQYNPARQALARCIELAINARSQTLKQWDQVQSEQPLWFAYKALAYCTYVDKFAKTFDGLLQKLDYLKDLGVTLIHPLPCLKARSGDSDGGFAVADFRDVEPELGSFDDLVRLCDAARARGQALILDVVCNHTAMEHQWAQGFVAGDPRFDEFYIKIDDKGVVDQWEENLFDVFPDTAKGNFTYNEAAGGYIWTTFYSFQWDLNYANPWVFVEMADVLFNLANAGVAGFRLDSAPFLWKRLGTDCRNQPETHIIVEAFQRALKLVAPANFLLAEAIESPESAMAYLGTSTRKECDLAYNNTLMTALWGALCDEKTDIIACMIEKTSPMPTHARWLNYARCHDDIIWTALRDDVPLERLFKWSEHYNGKGFSKGMGFQAPKDMPLSSCGMAYDLCGGEGDKLAVSRLKLIYGFVFAASGIPLIYMGDEIGLENDFEFLNEVEKRNEKRWLHRPLMDWQRASRRDDRGSEINEVFSYFKCLKSLLDGLDFDDSTAQSAISDGSLITLARRLKTGAEFRAHFWFSECPYAIISDPHAIRLWGNEAQLPYNIVFDLIEPS